MPFGMNRISFSFSRSDVSRSLLSYAFLVLLLEIWSLYRQDSEKISILLAAVCIMIVILPLLCASVFDKGELLMGSPLGIFIHLWDGKKIPWKKNLWLLAYYLLLYIVPLVLVWKRWGVIQEVRMLFDREPSGKAKNGI